MRHWRVRAAVAVAAVVALAACTSAPPEEAPATPSPSDASESAQESTTAGDRVAVVVGPPSHVSAGEAAALTSAARVLAADPPPGIADVRVVAAESAAFTADLVELFVSEEYDLVCIVGAGAAPLVLDAARAHRRTRLCATDPAVEGGPDNVVAVGIDPVALTTLSAAAMVSEPPPVGMVLAPSAGTVEVVEPLLTSLLPPVPAPSPSPTPGPTGPDASPPDPPAASPDPPAPPDDGDPTTPPRPAALVVSTTDQSVAAAVDGVVAADASVAALLLPRATEQVERLIGNGVRSVVVDDWARAPGAPPLCGVVAAITVDRAAQLQAAIDAALAEDVAQVAVLGLADDVLGVEAGSARGSERAVRQVRDVLDDGVASATATE